MCIRSAVDNTRGLAALGIAGVLVVGLLFFSGGLRSFIVTEATFLQESGPRVFKSR